MEWKALPVWLLGLKELDFCVARILRIASPTAHITFMANKLVNNHALRKLRGVPHLLETLAQKHLSNE